jgi:hypothetical protein
MSTKSNHGTSPSSSPNKVQLALLIVAILIALVVAAKFGSGFFREVAAERQQFGPSPEAVKKMRAEYLQSVQQQEARKKTSQPGQTPDGDTPKSD